MLTVPRQVLVPSIAALAFAAAATTAARVEATSVVRNGQRGVAIDGRSARAQHIGDGFVLRKAGVHVADRTLRVAGEIVNTQATACASCSFHLRLPSGEGHSFTLSKLQPGTGRSFAVVFPDYRGDRSPAVTIEPRRLDVLGWFEGRGGEDTAGPRPAPSER